DNWAIKGVAYANRDRGTHIITTAIEHHAVLHTCEYLERQGFTVTYLPVDRFGRVDPADVAGAITDETVLVSVMAANNEIGTVEPIAAIGAIAKEHGIPFHCDAVQAIGHLPIDVDALSVDLLSLSGHKFYGPKGTGALYIRKGTRIDTFMHGGGQEAGRRAGTENLPGIVGLGAAIERACTDIDAHAARLAALRDRLIEGLVREIPGTYLNGHPNDRLPGNANCSFAAVDGEALLYLLDAEGICCSTGSACSSGSESPSHVLAACGIDPVLARASLRFTLGDATTPEDIETVIAAVADAVRRLRALSPLGAHYS
ncbi:MAG: aminotransferase class V-fold PLP-dependent enzyme, partial [Methanomicrobiales archaeon]|nr:aminotransferase class V-fold PLP-dependent enzyme [Methanomicrobiales archaeon]